MLDADYEALRIKASICPSSESWPTPDFSKVSITGGKPHVPAGDLHWVALHGAKDAARTRTLKALGSMAAVDDDKSLSPTGKLEKKKEIAAKAIAEIEGSKSLDKARASVESQVARWNRDIGVTPKLPTDVATAMQHAEIRARVMAQKPGDRMAFITANIADVAPAILTAPPMLSGLTKGELDVVRHSLEQWANPEIAKAKQATIQALAHAEQGFRNAIRTISDRAGVTVSGNGVAA